MTEPEPEATTLDSRAITVEMRVLVDGRTRYGGDAAVGLTRYMTTRTTMQDLARGMRYLVAELVIVDEFAPDWVAVRASLQDDAGNTIGYPSWLRPGSLYIGDPLTCTPTGLINFPTTPAVAESAMRFLDLPSANVFTLALRRSG